MQGTAVPFRIAMSGKNFRVAQAGKRTHGEGKQVSNKVLLATPDNEYELMRADWTYVDLPHHLSLHEPTQNIEFVYFPNRGKERRLSSQRRGRPMSDRLSKKHSRSNFEERHGGDAPQAGMGGKTEFSGVSEARLRV